MGLSASKIAATVCKAPDIVKSLLHIGQAETAVQIDRLETCAGCDNPTPCWPGGKLICCGAIKRSVTVGRGCGCVLRNMIKQRRDRCPERKWEK